MIGSLIAVVLAALVVVGGLVLPTQDKLVARLYRLGRGRRLPAWLGGLAALTVLAATVPGASGSRAGAFLLVVVVALVVLLGLAIGWSWARLRLLQ